jgi:hypothetical protein
VKRQIPLVLAMTVMSLTLTNVQIGVASAKLHGICDSGIAGAHCLRVANNRVGEAVTSWPRDICCDAHQDWTARYVGGVSSKWPFRSDGYDLNGVYHGVGVYELFSNAGNCAAEHTGLDVTLEPCHGATGVLWVWTRTGALINVFASSGYGSPQYLYDSGAYDTVDTYGTDDIDPPSTWAQYAGR